MEGTAEGYVSGAGLQRPLHCRVIYDSEGVEFVLGEEIFGIVELLWLL